MEISFYQLIKQKKGADIQTRYLTVEWDVGMQRIHRDQDDEIASVTSMTTVVGGSSAGTPLTRPAPPQEHDGCVGEMATPE